MTSKYRGNTFLPEPQTVQYLGKKSRLSSEPFKALEPTKDQFRRLPDEIKLSKSKSHEDPQAYSLDICEDSIEINSAHERGWHYAILTLTQLAQQTESYLPQCRVEDYPDFERRGVMLDISRNKVPTLETLFYLIDLFASWKINELQLYIEHTFAYKGHEAVWQSASPLTKSDIRKLDTYCNERFIELVPNLNCFGHMTGWLTHDAYRPLAEQPQGGETDYGYRRDPQGLCATDEGSLKLASDLIDQMVSCFNSKQVNVGCDETIDLGYGRSRKTVKKKGRGRVYLDYLKKVQEICQSNGRTMQFWADILLKYPELIPEVPCGCIALNWGYEGNHPFEEETSCLKKSGIDYYVCPGTSSWNSIGGRTANMILNISSAAQSGKANGAKGLMTTDWGDNGHWQPLVSSFPGLILGASKSWNQSFQLPLGAALDHFVFEKEGWGRLILEIGNLDQPLGTIIHNKSALFALLQEDSEYIRGCMGLDVDKLFAVQWNAKDLQSIFKDLKLRNSIDATMEQEIDWVIEILIHACKRGISILKRDLPEDLTTNALKLREQHQLIWHLRNRPGGYSQSRALFNVLT
jgi:hypothetical protein